MLNIVQDSVLPDHRKNVEQTGQTPELIRDLLDLPNDELLGELKIKYGIYNYSDLESFLVGIERKLGKLLDQKKIYENRMRRVLLGSRGGEKYLRRTELSTEEGLLRDIDRLMNSLGYVCATLQFPDFDVTGFLEGYDIGRDGKMVLKKRLKTINRLLPGQLKKLKLLLLTRLDEPEPLAPIELAQTLDLHRDLIDNDLETLSTEKIKEMLELLAKYGILSIDDLKNYIEHATIGALDIIDETEKLKTTHNARVRRDVVIYIQVLDMILEALQDGRISDDYVLADFVNGVMAFVNGKIQEMPQIPDLVKVDPISLLGRIRAKLRLGGGTRDSKLLK